MSPSSGGHHVMGLCCKQNDYLYSSLLKFANCSCLIENDVLTDTDANEYDLSCVNTLRPGRSKLISIWESSKLPYITG